MKPTELTITKQNVVCYKLRHPSGMYWADITLDINQDKKGGRISIASDYGDWQRYWGATNNFKEFLSKIHIDYAAGKFGCDKHFDTEHQVNIYRIQVLQARRSGQLTSGDARLIYDELKELEHTGNNETEFYGNASELENLFNFLGHYIELSYDIEPGFKRFWSEVWPAFLSYLKQEEEALSTPVAVVTSNPQAPEVDDNIIVSHPIIVQETGCVAYGGAMLLCLVWAVIQLFHHLNQSI